MSTEELLNAFSRYDSRHKVKNTRTKNRTKKIAKMQNSSNNELNQAEILQKNR